MRAGLFILVFYLCLWSLRGQNCASLLRSQGKEASNLETGSFIMTKIKESRSHRYSVNLRSEAPESFQTTVSIGYMHRYKDDNGLDFSIRSYEKNRQVEVILFISETSSWEIIYAYYFANWNDFISVGFFSTSPIELLDVQEKEKRVKIQEVVSWEGYGSDSSVVVLPFLSGIKTKDQRVSLDFHNAGSSFVNHVLSIELTVSDQNEPIENIYVSFLLYTKESPLVLEEVLQQKAEQEIVRQINGEMHEGEYFFGGLKHLDAAGLAEYRQFVDQHATEENSDGSQQQLLRRLKVHALDPTQVNVFIKTFEISSIVLRDQSSIELLRLDAPLFEEETTCLSSLSCAEQNGVLVEKDGVKRCAVCSSGEKFDASSGDCICMKGYARVDDVCLKENEICEEGEIFFDDKCLEIVIDLKECGPFEEYDEESKKCVCVTFAERNEEGICECSDGTHGASDETCHFCPENSSFNEELERCDCDEGYEGNGQICREIEDQGLLNLSGDGMFIVQFPPTRL